VTLEIAKHSQYRKRIAIMSFVGQKLGIGGSVKATPLYYRSAGQYRNQLTQKVSGERTAGRALSRR
jgi:hypothetical protein